jgi:hypothetical protein
LVDKAVVRMAAGAIKPVIVGKLAQLVRSDGIALYEEMTGVRFPSTATPSRCARYRPWAGYSPKTSGKPHSGRPADETRPA